MAGGCLGLATAYHKIDYYIDQELHNSRSTLHTIHFALLLYGAN